MNVKQLGLIHGLKRKAGLDDPSYRLILRNIGGVASSKDLSQSAFDEVMASIEEAGEANGVRIGTYWRDRLGKGSSGTARMIHKIHAIYASYEQLRDPVESTHYELAGLCRNAASRRPGNANLPIGRPLTPEDLNAKEAWTLIETLKSIVAREEQRQRAEGNRLFGNGHAGIGDRESGDPTPDAPYPEPELATIPDDDIPF